MQDPDRTTQIPGSTQAGQKDAEAGDNRQLGDQDGNRAKQAADNPDQDQPHSGRKMGTSDDPLRKYR